MALISFFQKILHKETQPDPADNGILVFGLGNTGKRYAQTRHNIGFRVAEALAARLDTKSHGKFAGAEYYTGSLFESQPIVVIKPLTLMNRSGIAVENYCSLYQCRRSAMLVIVDDFNLPFGKLRIRKNGSDGGHNGLKSIIGRIGEDFPRLRFGIGPLPEGTPNIDFVLGTFTGAEEALLKTAISRAVDACTVFAQQGIEAAMNTITRQ